MSLFSLAVVMRKGMYRLISWWPALLKKEEAEGDQIIRYPVLELDMVLRTLLRRDNSEGRPFISDFREIGTTKVMLHQLDPTIHGKDVLLEGIIHLIAGYPDFLTKMREWLIENGYDLGEFDIE